MGIGGGQSQQQSSSENYNVGENWSGSTGSNRSWQNPSTVWGAQSPYLADMYSQAQNIFQGAGTGRGDAMWNAALGGVNAMMNPGVNPQLAAYSQAVQRNLTDNLLPTIGSSAAGFGQYGGARQGVAEGVALERANEDITNMAANLYSQDRDRMLQTMGMLPSLGAFGMSVPWFNINQYAGLLGSPTVLAGGGGSEGQTASSSYGYNTGAGQSEGSGSSWNGRIAFPV